MVYYHLKGALWSTRMDFFLEILKISKNTSILVGDNVAKWDYVKWGDRTPVRGGGDVITGGILKALLGHCWTTLKHFSIFLESQTPRQKWNSLFWLNISSLLSLLEILGVCEWFSPDLRIPKMRSTKKEQKIFVPLSPNFWLELFLALLWNFFCTWTVQSAHSDYNF